MKSMATSVLKKQAYFKDNPITLNSNATGKISVYRNHCARYGNIFQFSVVFDVSTALDNVAIADEGAVQIPMTYDSTALGAMAIVDAHSLGGGRIRIMRNGGLTITNAPTGRYLYCCTYVIDD